MTRNDMGFFSYIYIYQHHGCKDIRSYPWFVNVSCNHSVIYWYLCGEISGFSCSKYEMFVWLLWYLSIEYKILNIGYIKLSDIVEKSGVIYWFVVLLLNSYNILQQISISRGLIPWKQFLQKFWPFSIEPTNYWWIQRSSKAKHLCSLLC